jgi:hypothetical protein
MQAMRSALRPSLVLVVRREKRRQAKRRLTNVEFGNALLDREIDYRNARKRDQENTARALVVASGALMTVLLALSGDTGVLSADSSWWTRGFLLLTLGAAVCAAACGAWAQFPRKYTRLGGEAFNQFNNPAFLDSAEDQVLGRTLGARIGIAKKLDDRHEEKAGWLKASFVLFVVAHEQGVQAQPAGARRGAPTNGVLRLEPESARRLMASDPNPAPSPPPDVAYPPLPTETDTRDGSPGENK